MNRVSNRYVEIVYSTRCVTRGSKEGPLFFFLSSSWGGEPPKRPSSKFYCTEKIEEYVDIRDEKMSLVLRTTTLGSYLWFMDIMPIFFRRDHLQLVRVWISLKEEKKKCCSWPTIILSSSGKIFYYNVVGFL